MGGHILQFLRTHLKISRGPSFDYLLFFDFFLPPSLSSLSPALYSVLLSCTTLFVSLLLHFCLDPPHVGLIVNPLRRYPRNKKSPRSWSGFVPPALCSDFLLFPLHPENTQQHADG